MLVNCVCSQDAIKLAEVEFQRERGMVDEVLRRIALEDCAEVALRRSKQEETKAFIAAFLKEQDEKKRAALESSAKEDRKIAEYWQMVRVGREWREEAGGAGVRLQVTSRKANPISCVHEEYQQLRVRHNRPKLDHSSGRDAQSGSLNLVLDMTITAP